MLTPEEQSTQEIEFLRTFDDLDTTIQRAQLIGKIEARANEAEGADSDEITQIQADLKSYRDEIRRLGQC